MKVLQLVGMTALLTLGAAAVGAQNLVTPGQLAGRADGAVTHSPFASGMIGKSSKHDTAVIEDQHEKRMRIVWITSIVAMSAATTADAVSSWHKQESNGLLASSNGTFGGRGIALKAGIAAGFLTPQIIFRKHRDWHAAFAVGNFAEAGIFTGAAIHNFRVKQ
jgi:hypothetical protein